MGYFKGNQGEWSMGKNGGCIVSDQMPNRPTCTSEEYEREAEYYGGYLIAESIPTEQDAKLIANSKKLLERSIRLYKICEKRMNGEPVDVADQAAAMMQLEDVFDRILTA